MLHVITNQNPPNDGILNTQPALGGVSALAIISDMDIYTNPNSPTFPIDGIITRLIIQHNRLGGIEMSTPGLRGQSGGPLFDANGIIYGMQSSTRHLHLGFDLENFEIPSGNQSKKITKTPFLHVGQCPASLIVQLQCLQTNCF